MYGPYIRAARERAKLSRADAASRVGISDDGLYKIETDKNQARLETLERMATAYGVLVGDLLPNTSTPIGNDLEPIAAAFVGLSREEIRDLVLNLASQARLMAAWRFSERDRHHSTISSVPAYTPPLNSGKTDGEAGAVYGADPVKPTHANPTARTAGTPRTATKARKHR